MTDSEWYSIWWLCRSWGISASKPRTNLLLLFFLFPSPVSRSQVSSQRQEVLMENVTRMSERSRLLQQTLGEASTEADLLENIWKLENLFQNHSDWLLRLEILIKVRHKTNERKRELLQCRVSNLGTVVNLCVKVHLDAFAEESSWLINYWLVKKKKN